jgi:transcriptional regulator with XRE-family HTH domain
MNLGKQIKDIRKSKNLTQAELANLSGITQTYLSQLERNKKEPNLSTLKTISFKLDIPIQILLIKSMTIEDIPKAKKSVFKNIIPLLENFINEQFPI